MKTPVDTGRARANWQISIGQKAEGTVNKTDPSPYGSKPNTTEQANKVAGMGKSDDTIYICNNLPYIGGLEYGKSRQSPNGMVGVTLAEFERVIDSSVNEVKKGE